MIRYLPLCCLLAACATTGDPNSGGLFGWSERKAHARQEALLREIDAAHAATQKEAAEYDYLKSTRSDLLQRRAALDELYQAMLAENAALRDQIQSLVQQETMAEGHLAELQPELEAPVGSAESFAELDSEADKQHRVAQLLQQNQHLRRALGL